MKRSCDSAPAARGCRDSNGDTTPVLSDRRYRPVFASIAITLTACLNTVAAPPANKPNIILIMTDQQFGDAMSCRMGTQYLRTPVMDSLASKGMVFTRAYSTNPLCMPLRHSLFTGRYPHETAVTRNECPPGGVDPSRSHRSPRPRARPESPNDESTRMLP